MKRRNILISSILITIIIIVFVFILIHKRISNENENQNDILLNSDDSKLVITSINNENGPYIPNDLEILMTTNHMYTNIDNEKNLIARVINTNFDNEFNKQIDDTFELAPSFSGITYDNDNIVSFIMYYSWVGAYPDYYYSLRNFNINSGKNLSISDVVNDNELEKIIEFIQREQRNQEADVQKKNGESTIFVKKEQLQFLLTRKELVIYHHVDYPHAIDSAEPNPWFNVTGLQYFNNNENNNQYGDIILGDYNNGEWPEDLVYLKDIPEFKSGKIKEIQHVKDTTGKYKWIIFINNIEYNDIENYLKSFENFEGLYSGNIDFSHEDSSLMHRIRRTAKPPIGQITIEYFKSTNSGVIEIISV